MRTQIWSSGGGTQSTAIAAMIVQGILPKPDLAVIADTGREASETWDYMERYTLPALEDVGVTLHRVSKSQYATVDLYGGKEKADLLIPAFTTEKGKVGKMPGFCSNEWKLRVVKRWATDRHVKSADLWMGITIDEIHRARFHQTGKWQNSYPLIERRMTRGDCIKAAERMGWPTPPRSSCWMCPNHTNSEWRHLRDNHPGDFQRAMKFERYIRSKDPDMWLHSDAKPLDEIDFDRSEDLFDRPCDSGACFV